MRIPILIAALVLTYAAAFGATPEQAARMIVGARHRYHQEAHGALLATVYPEFANHKDRLNGVTIKYAFCIDAQGHTRDIKTSSKPRSRWGEETTARAIRSVKSPRPSAQVLREERAEGHKLVEVDGEFGGRVK